MKKHDYSKADEAFRRQVGALIGITGMSRKELAFRIGISEVTLREHIRHPEKVTKGEERRLAMVAKQNNVPYDAGLTV